MDWSVSLANWLTQQLQGMPTEILQKASEMAGSRGPERILELFLGDREAEEVRALLERDPVQGPRPAAVFLPGIMGSLLSSVRGISTLLWYAPRVLLDGHLNLLDLDENGEDDRCPDVEIVPTGIEKVTYIKLVVALSRLARPYEFPYDWRRPLEHNAHLLHRSLARWTQADPDRRFTLVCHSMGGMLARTYTALYPEESERLIERIVMLGTPLYGAPVAACIFDGNTPQTRIVQRLNPANDVIAFASNLPSAYQLLPPPPDLFTPDRPYPFDWDVYDAEAWGVPHVRQDYLDRARAWHERLAASDPQIEMAVIAGCHQETVTDVHMAAEPDDHGSRLRPERRDGRHEGGDNQVPLWSTRHPSVTTYYIECSHIELPAHGKVIDALGELLAGGAPELPQRVPERATSLLEKIAPIPLLEQVADLRRHIEAGETRREDIGRITFLE